jgi:ketosteroid isomerase-like protein
MKTLLALMMMVTLVACTKVNEKQTIVLGSERIVRQYFEYFNNHEWAKMASMYADTAEFKDPSLGKGIIRQTRQQTIDKYSALCKIFPNLHDRVVQIYPSNDKYIIVEFVSTGTSADGVTFELPICTIFVVENGQITKDFTYFDNFDEEQSKP